MSVTCAIVDERISPQTGHTVNRDEVQTVQQLLTGVPIAQHPMNARGDSASQEHRVREAALDETLANTFPASDPLSSVPNPHDENVIAEPGRFD